MALTTLLNTKQSSVRRFMDHEFPDTRLVCKAANDAVRGGRSGDPPIAPSEGVDGALVGTAVEYVLPIQCGSIREPQVAGAPTRELALGRHEAAMLAVGELRRLGAPAKPVAGSELDLAVDCALVCARLEQRFRMGDRRARELQLPDPALGTPGGLSGVIEATMASAATRTDLAALLKAGFTDTADLYSARTLAIDPTFVLSSSVGGADADMIADHVLIDFKSGKGRSLVGVSEIYQLIGYALLDVDDRYAISSVGIHALRWRTRWTMDLDELLLRLSGTRRDVSVWRSMFANVLSGDDNWN